LCWFIDVGAVSGVIARITLHGNVVPSVSAHRTRL
jgi:hypothetical protein